MSTYYTAGGMPLAFAQEDFLVSGLCLSVKKFTYSLELQELNEF